MCESAFVHAFAPVCTYICIYVHVYLCVYACIFVHVCASDFSGTLASPNLIWNRTLSSFLLILISPKTISLSSVSLVFENYPSFTFTPDGVVEEAQTSFNKPLPLWARANGKNDYLSKAWVCQLFNFFLSELIPE